MIVCKSSINKKKAWAYKFIATITEVAPICLYIPWDGVMLTTREWSVVTDSQAD
jgi:hypothetical protein